MKSKRITCPKCGSDAKKYSGIGYCPKCGIEWAVRTGEILEVRMSLENAPKAVKSFIRKGLGNVVSVRLPILYEEYYDKETGRMKRYGDEFTVEDLKEARKWLKKHGFEWDPRAHCWWRYDVEKEG